MTRQPDRMERFLELTGTFQWGDVHDLHRLVKEGGWFDHQTTDDKVLAAELADVRKYMRDARDEDGDILEVSESIWPADRVMLIDDYPIEPEPEQPIVPSEV